MPALLFSAFALLIFISALLGLILAYPMWGLIVVAVSVLIAGIHDYRKGVL